MSSMMFTSRPKKMSFWKAVGFYTLSGVIILIGLMFCPVILLLEALAPSAEDDEEEACRHMEEEEDYE